MHLNMHMVMCQDTGYSTGHHISRHLRYSCIVGPCVSIQQTPAASAATMALQGMPQAVGTVQGVVRLEFATHTITEDIHVERQMLLYCMTAC